MPFSFLLGRSSLLSFCWMISDLRRREGGKNETNSHQVIYYVAYRCLCLCLTKIPTLRAPLASLASASASAAAAATKTLYNHQGGRERGERRHKKYL